MVPTATPAVRPFSMHDVSKVVTDSAQRKLDRKRANARIRQQRCRARKRARAMQEEAKQVPNSDPPKQSISAAKNSEGRATTTTADSS